MFSFDNEYWKDRYEKGMPVRPSIRRSTSFQSRTAGQIFIKFLYKLYAIRSHPILLILRRVCNPAEGLLCSVSPSLRKRATIRIPPDVKFDVVESYENWQAISAFIRMRHV
jgi:hypothetical protein